MEYKKIIDHMALDMIHKFEKNEHKADRGMNPDGSKLRGWENCSWQYLVERAREELDELVCALVERRYRDAQLEASDVSNFMAMIHDNIAQKRFHNKPETED